jgi:hypothetical protein
MKTFLISYNLLNPYKYYDSLFFKLKLFSRWWRYLNSTWIVISSDPNDNASTLANKLTCEIDKSIDTILVLEIDIKSADGWLPKEAWDWIKSNQKPQPPAPLH